MKTNDLWLEQTDRDEQILEAAERILRRKMERQAKLTDPTSAASRFLLSNAPVPNQPGQMNLVFSPLVAGRTYTVKASTTLGPSAVWTDLTSFTILDNGTTRTITDLDATGSAKFYNVEIERP